MSKNTKSVEEMTLEEVQREIASIRERTCTDENCDDNHWPLATLDTVAALMPPLWKWEKFDGLYVAWIPGVHKSGPEVVVEDTGDEKADRFRLLLLILRKESNV